jgi:hypothetical protein
MVESLSELLQDTYRVDSRLVNYSSLIETYGIHMVFPALTVFQYFDVVSKGRRGFSATTQA